MDIDPKEVEQAIDEWERFTAQCCLDSVFEVLTMQQYERTKALIVKALQETRKREKLRRQT